MGKRCVGKHSVLDHYVLSIVEGEIRDSASRLHSVVASITLLKSIELDTLGISNSGKVKVVRGSTLVGVEGAHLVLVYFVLVFA